MTLSDEADGNKASSCDGFLPSGILGRKMLFTPVNQHLEDVCRHTSCLSLSETTDLWTVRV